jgi:hypothetical protein
MKKILLYLIICMPSLATAQDSINPYNTQLPNTIDLHYTDVYYCPMAPPALTDTSWQLSSASNRLLNPDGIYNVWPPYEPKTHGTLLQYWSPCGAPLGPTASWQRFFTAKRHGGIPSDIIAGGLPHDSVIISKNEDVDFRASGTIKLENGFHVMPGARFHAYTEPTYDSLIFSDDFDSINHSQWYIANNMKGIQPLCSTDTDVRDTLDPDALDGHALDIFLREVSPGDSCYCLVPGYSEFDSCNGVIARPPTTFASRFYSAVVQSCPFPYLTRMDTPLVPVSQHMPYGKYETRKKIPHFPHHSNDWQYNSWEIDMNETQGDTAMHQLYPNLHQWRSYGPFKGVFRHSTLSPDGVIFISHAAQWSMANAPHYLNIDNFYYEVWTFTGHSYDTVYRTPRSFGYMGWPPSLVSDTIDSVSFYYERLESNTASTTTWTVDSTGRIFSAPYHDSSGTWLRFSKAYQPTQLTLRDSITLGGDTVAEPYTCHWEYNLNPPYGTGDSGILYLDQPLSPTKFHINTEAYQYTVNEDIIGNTFPSTALNLYDTVDDYKYHTFGVEILPHELRYLIDSNVVLRIPDRMIPVGDPAYGLNLPRAPLDFYLGEFDLNADSAGLSQQQAYFEHAASVPGWPGFAPVTIGGVTYPAAHELIDYVRVWDIPNDVTVPNFPR